MFHVPSRYAFSLPSAFLSSHSFENKRKKKPTEKLFVGIVLRNWKRFIRRFKCRLKNIRKVKEESKKKKKSVSKERQMDGSVVWFGENIFVATWTLNAQKSEKYKKYKKRTRNFVLVCFVLNIFYFF